MSTGTSNSSPPAATAGTASSSFSSSSAADAFTNTLFAELAFSSDTEVPDLVSNTTESIERFASSDVILLMSRMFLDDVDVNLLGRCNHATLNSLRKYEMREEVTLDQLLKHRWECADMLNALTCAQRTIMMSLARKLMKKKKWQTDEEFNATSNMKLIPHSAEYQIGRYVHVVYGENVVTAKQQFILGLLHLLPPFIRSIRLSSHQKRDAIKVVPTLPIGLTYFELIATLEFCLSQVVFPQKLKELRIYGESSSHSQSFVCPPQLTFLSLLGFEFDPSTLILPSTLNQLHLNTTIGVAVEKLVLPEGLTTLTFDGGFNRSIDDLRLPSTLTHLDLGDDYNQPLVNWNPPSSLTEFTLQRNWILSGDQLRLPPGLTKFKFHSEYDQPIDGIKFPPILTELQFGYSFNQSLRNVNFPDSISFIRFGSLFRQSLRTNNDWTPPSNLRDVCFKQVNVPYSHIHLPDTVTRLYIGGNRYEHRDRIGELSLPSQLSHLIIELKGGWTKTQKRQRLEEKKERRENELQAAVAGENEQQDDTDSHVADTDTIPDADELDDFDRVDYCPALRWLSASYFPSSLTLIEVDPSCLDAWTEIVHLLPAGCQLRTYHQQPNSGYGGW